MIKKYRKKPVVIEALEFTRDNFEDVIRFTNGKVTDFRISEHPSGLAMCVIPTLEGNHIAREGGLIIKGVHGEFYPCKPDIFAKTYEDAAIDPESLRPKGEWISVKDRLPEEKQDVLLFFGAVEGCVGMAVGFYEIEDEIPAWYGKSDGEFYSDCWQWPTHWMPLPERPALKNKENSEGEKI